jgi:LysR family glycine cleavage system transcriptional activator
VRVLTISVGPTFAMKWLIPGWPISARKVDIEVRITTGGAAAPFNDDWSWHPARRRRVAGLTAEPLFAADLLPVCAPRLRRSNAPVI